MHLVFVLVKMDTFSHFKVHINSLDFEIDFSYNIVWKPSFVCSVPTFVFKYHFKNDIGLV
jgi:hypothetical protein